MSTELISPAWGCTKSPRFNTIVQDTAGLQQVAVSLTDFPVWDFKCMLPFVSGRIDDKTSAVANLLGFFFKNKGRAGTFLFTDPRDNTVTAYQFATGNASTKVFQLLRPVGQNGGIDLVQNPVANPAIYLNGVLQTSGYSIDSKGVVTFTSAPGSSVAITWTGTFQFLCRFSADTWADLKLFTES